MKISVEVDCTPEEARRFLGLPDVSELNAAAIEALRLRMSDAAKSVDLDAVMKVWLPAGLQGVEQWQKFWAQFASGNEQKGKRHG